ncbi:MAG TPA: asparagine synthase (glutamine-hydrolyzing) [Polyangia bacterium]
MIDPAGLGAPASETARAQQDAVARMTATLTHRGPDGAGSHHQPGVTLGHRRLKVLDLSERAAQPMRNQAGTVVLVFNGEIYNFADLRAELQSLGHRFDSKSDTEVLLHGYEAWGDTVVDRLSGMFAFALWDDRRRRLLAARDRMGKKPFYFVQLPRPGLPPLFAFASELRALHEAPGFQRHLDHRALARYLVHEYVPPPATIFAGVHKLDAGERLVLALARDLHAAPVVDRYWNLPLVARHAPMTMQAAAGDLWTLLKRAVERRLVADVPVGIFLSGGLDSSAVTAAATALCGPVDTFSIGFSDPSYDESAHARTVAAHLGTRHHEHRLDARGMLDLLPDVARILDEPLADASIIPTVLLSRFARQHVTVALGGDGGDELFAGYPTFAAEGVARGLDLAPRGFEGLLRALADRLPRRDDYFGWDFKLQQFLRGGPVAGPVRHQRWLASFLPEELPHLLTPATRAAAGVDVDVETEDLLAPVRAPVPGAPADLHPFDRLFAFYCRFYLANDVNVKVDRAAGAAGLEVRAPLLDADLVAFACQVPPHLRHPTLRPKALLKRALAPHLPAAILKRRKQGFAVPVARWLKTDLRALLCDELAPDKIRREGLFDPATVAGLVDDHLSGRRDRRKQLWTLLSFARWRATWM